MNRQMLRGPGGILGRLVERLPNGNVVVEVNGEVRRWHASHAHPVKTGPRGVVRANDRAREAAALVATGLTHREVAEQLGVSSRAVSAMVARARAADEEERNGRRLG